MDKEKLITFKDDSKKLVEILISNDLDNAKNIFEVYKNDYQVIICDSNSEFYIALPFYKSVEEYLYNPLAKERGFVSVKDIKSFLEDDILNLK